jgi:phosphoribosyl-ATP pyrophosphohydrolase
LITKVHKFLETIGADTSLKARLDKCVEEDFELMDALLANDFPAVISEVSDRIITGYALLIALGGNEATIIDKMQEVMQRPEYQNLKPSLEHLDPT